VEVARVDRGEGVIEVVLKLWARKRTSFFDKFLARSTGKGRWKRKVK
jgi:hypothetical protein